MMKETNIQAQVTSTIAGDDGEAVAKSEENAKKMAPKTPNEGLEKPADAGWYVAVVRVNCETRIAILYEAILITIMFGLITGFPR